MKAKERAVVVYQFTGDPSSYGLYGDFDLDNQKKPVEKVIDYKRGPIEITDYPRTEARYNLLRFYLHEAMVEREKVFVNFESKSFLYRLFACLLDNYLLAL